MLFMARNPRSMTQDKATRTTYNYESAKVKNFTETFQKVHLQRLTQSHLNLILKKKTQFVGTRTLALSIKFLTQSMTQKDTRMMIKPHIETILFDISLPLFMTTQKDIMTFNQDPVEYVRLQVDNNNEWNVKKQLAKFVQTLCSLKFGKKGQNQ